MEIINQLTNHSDIFKLHYKNTVYVFCQSLFVFFEIENKIKKENIEKELKKVYDSDPDNRLFSFFTQEERINYKDKTILFINEQIYWDDTIETIKLKISIHIENLSMFEIYLYFYKTYTIDPIFLYEVLSKNNTIDITIDKLNTFLLNLVDKDTLLPLLFPLSTDEQHYQYQDIIELNLSEKEYLVCSTLAQKYILKMDEYVYTTNPFLIETIDIFTEKEERKSLLLNTNLLLNSKNIYNNNIYLCSVEDVLNYTDSLDLNENLIIKLYFPYLYKLNIHSKTQWLEEKENLLKENNKKLSPSFLTEIKNINMFYNIFKLRKFDLPYESISIKSFKITMFANSDIKIPLEIIFKILHSTELNPFIKYNPSNKKDSEEILVKNKHIERKENMYRLFTDQITEDGRKIPFLPKGTIFRLMRDIGKVKSISTLISIPHKFKSSYDFICEFFENGKIIIYAEFENNHSLFIHDLELLIKEFVNPVLLEIKKFVEQNGIQIHLFNSFYDENVDINEITYNTIIPIREKINIKQLSSCVNNIFNIESNTDNEIDLLFKRVSNFNKLNSIDSFLLSKIRQNMNLSMIANELVKNFSQFDKKSAIERVKNLATQLQVEQGLRKNRLEIKINEGFTIIFQINPLKSSLLIQVRNINNIYYLRTIPVYLDSLIRITQDKNSTLFPLKEINSLCNIEKKVVIKEPEIVVVKKVKKPKEEKTKSSKTKAIPNPEPVRIPSPIQSPIQSPILKSILKSIPEKEVEEEEEEEEEPIKKKEEPIQKKEEEEVLTPHEKEIKKLTPEIKQKENNLLDVWDDILGNMDESDEEEEEEDEGMGPKKKIIVKEEEEEEEEEDAEEEGNNVLDVTGTKLKSPYYWQKRMETYDPTLFKTIKNDKFNSYSRICPANVRRQPVILTKEQLNKIKEEYPDELKQEDILKYSATEGKDFYYICPRYWCFLTNSYITKEDVDKGVCGGIIPQSAKTIPKGKYVYEFFSEQSHGSQENYLKHYPTFHSKKRTDEGYFIPCCNRIWNTEAQRKLKKEAEEHLQIRNEIEDEPNKLLIKKISPRPVIKPIQTITPSKSIDTEVKKQNLNYVIGPERFPIEKNKWGYLPPSIQYFFNESAFECQVSAINKNIKENHLCLLRMGVENSLNQSFIACLSMIKYYNKDTYIPSISEMKEIIIQSINLDNFIQLQNGNLITYFGETERHVDIYNEKYRSTNVYKKIETHGEFLKKVIIAYENFIDYLRNDEVLIDYTYLWDLISMPNPLLFTSGLNLVILEIPDNDATMNVEIICPSNHYSQEIWDSRRSSIFIIKKNNQFEPIFSLFKKKKKLIIQEIVGKKFSEFDKTLPSNIKIILTKIIKPIFLQNCKPLNSNPQQYDFYLPIELNKIIKEINKKHYIILSQVVNFNGKMIGLKVKNKKEIECIIPCNPTFIQVDLPIQFIDEDIWNTYENTLSFLTKWFHKNSLFPENPKNNCNPFCIVVEEEQIIGFLTNTNQFISISVPVPNISSSIPPGIRVIHEDNYLMADIENMERKKDTRRINYIKKIKYETYFFNAFRNLIKILINKFTNLSYRKQIQEVLENKLYFYTFKLKKIIYLLKKITEQYIFFTNDIDIDSIDIELMSCINNNEEDCRKNSLCTYSVSKKCVFKIPKDNLITKTNNVLYYYSRMADELIRYYKTNQFIFQPDVYQNFENVQFKLNDNEIILIQSMITQEYFASLVPYEMNKYIKNNTIDDAEPREHQYYTNQFATEKVIEEKACFIKKNIQSIMWKKCFPKLYQEYVYNNTISCSYQYIIDIIVKIRREQYSVLQIKEILIEEYTQLFLLENFQEKIIDILYKQGKKILIKQLREDKINFKFMIYSDNYFLTNLDIWILISRFQIPTLMFSSIYLLETNYFSKSIVLFDTPEKSENYLCIFTQGYKVEEPNHFKYIADENQNIFISKEKITSKEECKVIITQIIKEYYTLKHFLTIYKILPTTEYLKKKGFENILPKPQEEKYVSPKKKVPQAQVSPVMEIIRIKKPKTVKKLLHQKEEKELKEQEMIIKKIKKPKTLKIKLKEESPKINKTKKVK
jgi:hypothetical protein